MLGFLKRNKAKGAVLQVVAVLRDGVQALSSVDRAATYAIAHGLLKASADTWGRAVVAAPSTLSEDAAAAVVVALVDSHGKVLDVLDALRERGMDDAQYSQAMRQLRATECAIAMVGRRWMGKANAKLVGECWGMLWRATAPEADAAVEMLVRYAKVAKVDGVPRPAGQRGPVTADQIRSLMTTLPEFLRKKPAPKAAKPAPAPGRVPARAVMSPVPAKGAARRGTLPARSPRRGGADA